MPLLLASTRVKETEEKSSSQNEKDNGIEGSAGNAPVDANTEGREALEAEGNQQGADFISPPRQGRVSKRVRSQMITTEKQAERKSKRESVEYCLLAGVLSCTVQNPYYTKLLKRSSSWGDLPLIKKVLPHLARDFPENSGSNLNADSSSGAKQIDDCLSPASLNSFVAKWSRQNSGPRQLLEVFLLHVSLNTTDVFGVEQADSFSSCIVDGKSLRGYTMYNCY